MKKYIKYLILFIFSNLIIIKSNSQTITSTVTNIIIESTKDGKTNLPSVPKNITMIFSLKYNGIIIDSDLKEFNYEVIITKKNEESTLGKMIFYSGKCKEKNNQTDEIDYLYIVNGEKKTASLMLKSKSKKYPYDEMQISYDSNITHVNF